MTKRRKTRLGALLLLTILFGGCAAKIPEALPGPAANTMISSEVVEACHKTGGVLVQVWERENMSTADFWLLEALISHLPSKSVDEVMYWDDNGGRVWAIWCVRESYYGAEVK